MLACYNSPNDPKPDATFILDDADVINEPRKNGSTMKVLTAVMQETFTSVQNSSAKYTDRQNYTVDVERWATKLGSLEGVRVIRNRESERVPPSIDPSQSSSNEPHDAMASLLPKDSMVTLSISCKDLANLDILSKSDPQVWVYKQNGSEWDLMGKTETIDDNLNPIFATTFQISSANSNLKFVVYDIDKVDGKESEQDLIGTAIIQIQNILDAKGHAVTQALQCSKRKKNGYITVSAKVVKMGKELDEAVDTHKGWLEKRSNSMWWNKRYFVLSPQKRVLEYFRSSKCDELAGFIFLNAFSMYVVFPKSIFFISHTLSSFLVQYILPKDQRMKMITQMKSFSPPL